MLIPLGHEKTAVRRLPWVTFAIMALCFVVFILGLPGELRQQVEVSVRLHRVLVYFSQHPYLELSPRIRDILVANPGEGFAADTSGSAATTPPENPRRLAWEQRRFDHIVTAYFTSFESSTLYRYGVVPARPNNLNYLTYQFLHVGWIHLFFNLLFLYLMGPFIEDVWGRPIFAAFYLAGGAFAGFMFAIRFPDLDTPLVGASGAVAAVLGAFFVRFLKSKIRFIVWIFVPLGPFHAPAWLLLPLWFVIQLRGAVTPNPDGGVAGFWAHVWGFLFGAVFAFVMAYFRVESLLINEAIETKVKVVDNTVVDKALSLADNGKMEAAFSALERELHTSPDDVEATMALWNLRVRQGEGPRALPHMLRSIEAGIRGGDLQFAMNYWESVLELDTKDLEVDALLAVRIAEILEADRRLEAASRTMLLAHQRSDDMTPVAVILRIARLALLLEAPEALDLVDDALKHPRIPQESRPELEVARWALSRRMGESEDSVAQQAGERYLQVTVAVPVAVNNRMLSVDVRGAVRQVVFDTVKVVAVAAIIRESRKPVAVIDLFLDHPSSGVLDPRTMRLFGDSFDSRNLIGGEDPRKAFRNFLGLLIESSDAEALPDPDGARANPFRSFISLEEYELETFGVVS